MKFHKFLICIAIYTMMGQSQASLIPYVSQCEQDKILNQFFFKSKTNGVFVDIGAHDGISYSNTYFFEKALHWKGICFEPMPNQFEQLKLNRNCTCINACVSQSEEIVPFVLVDSPAVHIGMLSGMLDTYDPRHLDRMKQDIASFGGSYSIINVPSVRLDKVLKNSGITEIDYLSIDTEGGELNILKTIDFNEIKISAISVENNFREPELKSFLNSKGFTLVAILHGYDELYIHNTKMSHLMPIPAHISKLK